MNPGNTTLISDLPTYDNNSSQNNNSNLETTFQESPILAANEVLGGSFSSW